LTAGELAPMVRSLMNRMFYPSTQSWVMARWAASRRVRQEASYTGWLKPCRLSRNAAILS